mgnify:CR=1 FL=1
MNYKLKNNDIALFNESKTVNFPKYTSQLINLANQNAQGTRPNTVGQLSELFLQYTEESSDMNINDWEQWYTDKYPDSIGIAADKIFDHIQKLKRAIELIDKDMVSAWVDDLVITKTFNGLYIQKAILASLAEIKGESYRLATPEEESKGIDGYIGTTPYSIKPDLYKTKSQLSEVIDVRMIYYKKVKDGFKIEVEN